MKLTILMPCLNEQNSIADCIRKAQQFIENNSLSAEILIADNGSTDDSAMRAEKLGARVVHIPKRGYGNALMGGIRQARGKYIIMGDCDMSYDFLNLEVFLKALRLGYDLVMGNRFQGGFKRAHCRFHTDISGFRFCHGSAGQSTT